MNGQPIKQIPCRTPGVPRRRSVPRPPIGDDLRPAGRARRRGAAKRGRADRARAGTCVARASPRFARRRRPPSRLLPTHRRTGVRGDRARRGCRLAVDAGTGTGHGGPANRGRDDRTLRATDDRVRRDARSLAERVALFPVLQAEAALEAAGDDAGTAGAAPASGADRRPSAPAPPDSQSQSQSHSHSQSHAHAHSLTAHHSPAHRQRGERPCTGPANKPTPTPSTAATSALEPLPWFPFTVGGVGRPRRRRGAGGARRRARVLGAGPDLGRAAPADGCCVLDAGGLAAAFARAAQRRQRAARRAPTPGQSSLGRRPGGRWNANSSRRPAPPFRAGADPARRAALTACTQSASRAEPNNPNRSTLQETPVGLNFLRIATLYLIVGVLLGFVMGITEAVPVRAGARARQPARLGVAGASWASSITSTPPRRRRGSPACISGCTTSACPSSWSRWR